jgi:hypothetical protein
MDWRRKYSTEETADILAGIKKERDLRNRS